MMKSKKDPTRTIDELRVISDLSTLFSSTMELPETLNGTIKLVSHLTKADACFLYLTDNKTSDLVLMASKTPHPKEIGKIRLKMGEGITGWVAQHHKPVVIPQGARNDKRFVRIFGEDQYEAFISIPILIKKNVVGVINIHHRKRQHYSPRTIELLSTIGKQVGGAIETARLYEETRRKAQVLETLSIVSNTVVQDKYLDEIMQLIVNMTAQMMGSNICSILLLDEKKNELRVAAAQSQSPEYLTRPPMKVAGSIIGKVVTTKKPSAIRDVRTEANYQLREMAIQKGLVSLLSVPMMYKNKVLGVLNVYTPHETNFSSDEISFVQSVSNQCAAAIENTKLLSEKLAAQEALKSRKLLEKAKGLIMKSKNLTEEQAFREIQKQSMNRRKTMKDISEAIILAHEIAPQ